MAKAVLVMDMPEQVCYKCSLCYEVPPEGDYYMCAALGTEIPDGEIPDWCPLRELPEKMETGTGWYGEKMFRLGFNACLDEIIGRNANEK